ncbi:MAG TPA: DUF4416 family protein [Clostridiales bacterium]|nr:DUF4416 family protein [Clostridiales bacterium]HPV01354.1 DUF4416 family protein [Clostridiales bacterium]
MGEIHSFEDEKLIVCTMYSDPVFLEKAEKMLVDAFGPYDLVSVDYPFSDNFSEYYDEELGGKAFRRIYSFERCIDPSRLAAIKTLTNSFEETLSENGKRRINLDPGLLNRGRLILASTKYSGIRIPLSDGIYAEITLFYARGCWNELPWTYVDFRSELVKDFLTEVRKKYLSQRKMWLKGR